MRFPETAFRQQLLNISPIRSKLIETTRFMLRPRWHEDTDAFLQVFADPLMAALFAVDPFDRLQTEIWVQRNLTHQDLYGYKHEY